MFNRPHPAGLPTLAAVLGVGFLVTGCGGGPRVPATQPHSVTAATSDTVRAVTPAVIPTATLATPSPLPTVTPAPAGSPASAVDALLESASSALSPDERLALLTRAYGLSPGDPAVALALGRAMRLAGDRAGANAVLPVLAAGAPLRPYALAERARLMEGVSAAGTWNDVRLDRGSPASLVAEALTALAAIARQAGDTGAELALVTQLAAVSASGPVLYRLAELHAVNGLAVEPVQARLMRDFPRSREALEVATAASEREPLLAGVVFYRQGRLAQARSALQAALAASTSGPDSTEAQYYFGAALEDAGDFAAAVRAYDAVPTGSAFGHRARWWAATLTEALADPPGASARYLAVAAMNGSFSTEAGYRAGAIFGAAGEEGLALEAWAQVAAPSAKVRFWQARLLDRAGQPAAAAFADLAQSDTEGFYGLVAAARLGASQLDWHYRPLPDAEDDAAALLRLSSATGGQTAAVPAVITELLRAGFDAETDEALIRYAAPGPAETFAAASVAVSLGRAAIALSLYRNLEAAGALPGLADLGAVHRLRFPIGFRGELEAAALEFDVDPLLLAALVEQESLWDAEAWSFADARGLTQVIPPTAVAIASEIAAGSFELGQLWDPAVSLRFGAYYLSVQLRRLGSPEVALAAYNGGPGNAQRWAAGGGDAADFVRRVDFAETADYVERVIAHWRTYLALYPR